MDAFANEGNQRTYADIARVREFLARVLSDQLK
jgi:hypothetical protein